MTVGPCSGLLEIFTHSKGLLVFGSLFFTDEKISFVPGQISNFLEDKTLLKPSIGVGPRRGQKEAIIGVARIGVAIQPPVRGPGSSSHP